MRTVLVGKPASLPSRTTSKECREGLTMLLPPRRRLMLIPAVLVPAVLILAVSVSVLADVLLVLFVLLA
jgi:hypothetical protein